MAIEFTVILPNQPGSLARLGRALGDAGVNIEAIQVYIAKEDGVVRFVAADAAKTSRVLDATPFRHWSREVLVVNVLDEPGALGDVALIMATAGINIDSAYVTTRGHVVLGVDDLAGAVQVAGGLAVMIGE